MTSQDVARNQTQRAGQIDRVQGRVTNANVGIYTVTTGKRARVTDMAGRVNALGADAGYAIAIKKFIGGAFIPLTNFKGISTEDNLFASAVTMDSGDILTDIGDSGSTNGTFDLSATIEEFST